MSYPFIFLSWLARVTENLVLNTIRKEQLEKQAVEAELYYLKSQINPHFLFNTLNNIHTLVYKQAPAAPEAVMHLASLMRYMIYESNALYRTAVKGDGVSTGLCEFAATPV